MASTQPRRRRSRRALVVALALVTAVLAASCSDGDATDDPLPDALPDAAQRIVDQPAYERGSWSWSVTDLETGDIVTANQSERVNLLGSTTKLFTTGSYLDEIGPDATIETPVYARGDRADGTLTGDLVLVGKGDFVLGSRGVASGPLQFESPDHIYFYATPLAAPVAADPLAGLDALAAQVVASGITIVDGDVVVDDTLWEPYESKEGPVSPIMVNDDLLDLSATPGAAEGVPATVALRPQTAYVTVVDEVTTGAPGTEADLTATIDDARRVTVRGTVPAGGEAARTAVLLPDPAAYARALFVEALQRAGVTVTAPLSAPARTVPPGTTYDPASRVATLTSPPASELVELVLKTSHNRGSESLMCLLAVAAGSRDCTDGLVAMLDTVDKAGIDAAAVLLYDGEGSDPASATPTAMIDWLRWADAQSWAGAFRDALPDLVGDGSILTKSGTSARPELPPMPAFFPVQGESGYVTAASGRRLLVAVYASGATYASVGDGLSEEKADLEGWLAAIRDDN